MIKFIKKILKYIFRRFNWRFEKLYQRSDYNLETPNLKLLECLSKSKGVFHLGAHRGEEAPIYEWFGKKVIWVEANPVIFDELKDNLVKYKYQKAYKALIYNKDHDEIDFYLGEVTSEQFIADVKELIKRQTDKSAIDEAIKRLQELL
mgnify:CR=1 FL=1